MKKIIFFLIVLFVQGLYGYGQVNTTPIPARMGISNQRSTIAEFPTKPLSNYLQKMSGLSNGTFVLDTFYHYSVSPYVYNITAKDIMELDSFIYLNGDYRDFYPNATKPTNWKPFTMKIGQKEM